MDKSKLRRIMQESAFLRETALSTFRRKLSKKSYSEAKKIFRELGVEDEKELEDKVYDGEIDVEQLDVPAPNEVDNGYQEELDEDEVTNEEQAEDEDESKVSTMEKLIEVVDDMNNRVKELEQVNGDEEDELQENIDEPEFNPENEGNKPSEASTDKPLAAGNPTDGELTDDKVDKNADGGPLPEGYEGEEEDELKEQVDGEEEDELKEQVDDEEELTENDNGEEDDLPKPPIKQESVKRARMYSVDAKSKINEQKFSETLNTLFR